MGWWVDGCGPKVKGATSERAVTRTCGAGSSYARAAAVGAGGHLSAGAQLPGQNTLGHLSEFQGERWERWERWDYMRTLDLGNEVKVINLQATPTLVVFLRYFLSFFNRMPLRVSEMQVSAAVLSGPVH